MKTIEQLGKELARQRILKGLKRDTMLHKGVDLVAEEYLWAAAQLEQPALTLAEICDLSNAFQDEVCSLLQIDAYEE